jgi:exonuclease SbcC
VSVRLERFRCRGFGPFKGGFSADLTGLAPTDRLVAVCGENGAGKTTFLELFGPGAMWRSTPTRGSLVSLATERDAFMETTLVSGADRWTLRHLVDGVSGKSEALVLDGNGAAVLPDTKVAKFDAWAEANLPAPSLYFASLFAPQGAGGFLGAKPSARKDVLLLTLGPEMEALEAYATEARECLKKIKAELATLQARIADEQSRGGDVAELTAARAAAVLDAEGTREKADRLAALLDSLKTESLRLEAAAEQARQLEERREAAKAAHAEAAEALRVLEIRIVKNQGVLAQAATIRAAVVEDAALVAQAQADDAELARIAASFAAALSESAQHGRDAEQARAREAEERARVERLTAALEQAEAIEQAVLARPSAAVAYEEATAFVEHAEVVLANLRSQRLGGALGRIHGLRGGLEKIALDKPADPAALALKTCHDDEATELAEKALPGQITAAETELAERRATAVAAALAVNRLNELAARAGEVSANRAALVEATAAAERWAGDAQAAETRSAEGHAKTEAIALEAKPLEEAKEPSRVRREALAPLLKLVKPLEEAEAKLSEIKPLAEKARVDVARLAAALAALPDAQELAPLPDVEGAQRHAHSARQAADEAAKRLAQAEQRLELAKASSQRLAELDAERVEVEAALADWTRLASDLGKDGLQAMVIDGAIPELNQITNDLLHAAFGSRWTIDVRTQSSDAKGKRLLETLDVWFIDTERGREGLAETLSGGEKTIVAEALSLALTAIACRQARAERPTLIRDESAGQLSPGKTRAWIEMMRRAADIICADRILFVNHNPETWELADARIEVRSTGAAAA